MASVKALGGTSDIFPDEAERWQRLELQARNLFRLYGYGEIRTPLIEEAAVFSGSLGPAAEIVTKQMYVFKDRGGREVALRPEGTASVVRAFIEKGLDKTASLTRFYYIGPMFRAERPQQGRRRQFHQAGVEVFGSASPYQDVETILLLSRLLEAWGIRGWTLKLNSLGHREDRPRIVEHLRRKLQPHSDKLCADCAVRLEKNPLRILDCKEPGCQRLSDGIDLYEAVCADCRGHFEIVTGTLTSMDVPFERDPHMVRGLDYYTRTAFEVVHGELGAQNALGGGGRYDDLVEILGGAAVPAIGFAVGLERILMVQKDSGAEVPETGRVKVFVATVTAGQIPEGLRLVEALREGGIASTANLEDRPLKRQLESAAKQSAEGCVLILGEDEVRKGVVTRKQMATGTQDQLSRSSVVEELKRWSMSDR